MEKNLSEEKKREFKKKIYKRKKENSYIIANFVDNINELQKKRVS